jgi:hypothetical protein
MGYLLVAVSLIAAVLAVNNLSLYDERDDLKRASATQSELLNERIAEKEAVIARQARVIESKDKEIARTGVYRGADGRLHGLGR